MGWLDEIIDSKSDKFNESGPKHLLKVDWENSGHRRSVAACLVQGVYVAERDRQKSRGAYEARAPAWWESFHFKVIDPPLIDEDDSSIFGVVYQFNPPTATTTKAPRHVIALRGTFFHRPTVLRDVENDAAFYAAMLHRTSRFQKALKAVRDCCVPVVERPNVWLAGHSLGSSLATLVGKNMARSGVFLESFLFNPPFLPIPFQHIKMHEALNQLNRFLYRWLTNLLSEAANALEGKPKPKDSNLSPWVPCLFVNKADYICSGYVEYFQHRKTMEVAATKTGQVTTQNSVLDPVHLLPSANLIFHGSPSLNPLIFFKAHKLRQWWQADLQLECKEYGYKHRNAK